MTPRKMRGRSFLFAVLLYVGTVDSASAEGGFWERVRLAGSGGDLKVQRAVERVLQGRGEEMDLLLVRAALVELMRDQKQSPKTVILLFHLRRQLGLSAPQGGHQRLRDVLSRRLSYHEQALGYYELARLELDGQLAGAEEESLQSSASLSPNALSHLDRALSLSWEPFQRSELLLYRGLTAFMSSRLSQAIFDFEQAAQLSPSNETTRDAFLLLALSYLIKDDLKAASRALGMVRALSSGTSRAAPEILLADYPLSRTERELTNLALRAVPLVGKDPEDWMFEHENCQQLELLAEQLSGPFARLSAYLFPHCQQLTPSSVAPQ